MRLLPFALFAAALAITHPDQIFNLPGLSQKISFNQYAGLLNVTGSRTNKRLFYWFVESQTPSNTVTLWMNGGPGCSSLDGFLQEHGPFVPSTDGSTLSLNPYSWNLASNVLYLESPAGVGFSVADSAAGYVNDDPQTALDAWTALQSFFAEYTEFQGMDFYISGESYGGMYVPTLANRILEENANNPQAIPIKLRGIAVGNGLMDYAMNDNSLAFFGYYHAQFGDSFWASAKKACCSDPTNDLSCNFHDPTAASCVYYASIIQNTLMNTNLNMYGIYNTCYTGNSSFNAPNRYSFDRSHLFLKNRQNLRNVGVIPPCIDSRAASNYLNRADVQAALHVDVPALKGRGWVICSDILQYSRTYDSILPLYPALFQAGIRIWLYNGDTDMACNFLGNQWAIDALNQTTVQQRRQWLVGGQVAGTVEVFNQLTFVTVLGATHMVPESRPSQALAMFRAFINNQQL